jgi:hypothetical protein
MTTATIEELENKILRGETVTQSEFAEAVRNNAANTRFNELNKERASLEAKADVNRLAALKGRSKTEKLTPQKGLSLAFEINDLERKINERNK